jgi:cellulose synthase/poly-beta-1,6-N-acetylglucosamine synthase-like glycosyltransferase
MREPLVTIVLPTFDRASFLPDAFASIQKQTFTDWELIVVDDGSGDSTRAVVGAFAASSGRPVRYVYQTNQGPAAARNRGVREARTPYLAFFDSDDLWLPDYLMRGVTALEANPDIDWVFSACTIVDFTTGRTVDPNTFYISERARPFLSLSAESRTGDVRAIVDHRVLEYQVAHGLYCGPQNSIIRRTVFEHSSFPEHLRVGEDQLLVMSALAHGARLAYYAEPKVLYRLHQANTAPSSAQSTEHLVKAFGPLVDALQRFGVDCPLSREEQRALKKRVGGEYFWHLGYNAYWRNGRRREALEMFGRGLSAWPWDIAAWKTYVLSSLKTAVRGSVQ